MAQKPTQPYLWIVRAPNVPDQPKLPGLAFDQKEDAKAMEKEIKDATGRECFTTRVIYRSEIDRRIESYRMLVEMGLANEPG